MQEENRGKAEVREVERVVLSHLDAAYNLARWLVRDPQNAEDVVQEACLRALKFFSGFRGRDERAWLLRIVRNAAYSFLERNRSADLVEEFDEMVHASAYDPPRDAEAVLMQTAESRMLQEALEALPVRFREAVVLRELEGLSYKQISEVMEIPIGSVMSALARGRERLRKEILRARGKEAPRGVRR